jgi:hypothetical protein
VDQLAARGAACICLVATGFVDPLHFQSDTGEALMPVCR